MKIKQFFIELFCIGGNKHQLSTAAQQQIQNINKDINFFCPNCRNIQYGSKYCGTCGTKLVKVKECICPFCNGTGKAVKPIKRKNNAKIKNTNNRSK